MKNDKKPQSTHRRPGRSRAQLPQGFDASPMVDPQPTIARRISGHLDEAHRPRLVLFVGAPNSGPAAVATLWFGALATEGKATVVLAHADGAPPMVSAELMLALSEDGLDPRRLLPRPLTPGLVAAADLVVTMSSGTRSRMKLPPTTRRREHWTISDASAKPSAKRSANANKTASSRARGPRPDALAGARSLRDLLRARVAMLVFSEGWGRPEMSREDARLTRARSGSAEDGKDELLPMEPFASAGAPGVVPEITPPWFPQPSLSPPSLR
jgi:protein-tyrosine-phosphatase